MTTSKTLTFNNPDDWVFDADKIIIANGEAKLRLQDYANQTFTEDFSSDVGFTYDNTKAEFNAGKIEQKSQAPANSTSWATYTSSIDLNSGGGTLTGTGVGSPTITNNKLDLTGNTLKYVKYDSTNNEPGSQVGAVKFKLTTNYSGHPAVDQFFFTSANESSIVGRMCVRQSSDKLILSVRDDANNETDVRGTFNPVSGTTYEIEANWDLTNGETNLFINGIKTGTTGTMTGTRASKNTIFIGTDHAKVSPSDFYIEDLVMYDAVQHTSNYTPGYTLAEYLYLETFVESPTYSSAGSDDATLQSIDDFTVIDTAGTMYCFGSALGFFYWWDGATWALSDKTYAQSNTAEDLLAYLIYFPFPNGTNEFKVGVVFPDSVSSQNNCDTIDIEYTSQIYPTNNPTIRPVSSVNASQLFSFSTTKTVTGSALVKHIIYTSGTNRYVTGGSAADSNGTYAESSLDSEIDSDAENIVEARGALYPTTFLHSDDGKTSPIISEIRYSYNESPRDPNLTLCNFDVVLYDKDGPDASRPVYIRPFEGFINDNILHVYDWELLGTTDSTGWFDSYVYVQSEGNYWELKIGNQRYKIQLPNAVEADFGNLVSFEVIDV